MNPDGVIMQYEDHGETGLDGQVFEPTPGEESATDWELA